MKKRRNIFRPMVFSRPHQPAYLWRVNLVYLRRFSLKLHRFLNSDPDPCLHDHPWSFVSIILSGGYYEITEDFEMTWYGPGSILRRPADHKHRVVISDRVCGACRVCRRNRLKSRQRVAQDSYPCPKRKKVIPTTLFLTGRVTRRWGFWTADGWKHHDDFDEC